MFSEVGVKFALEVHPAEIAYDIYSTQTALEAIGHHESFCFNFDPSHLLWQGVDPVKFIDMFGDRIVHAHMKDVTVKHDGMAGVLFQFKSQGVNLQAFESGPELAARKLLVLGGVTYGGYRGATGALHTIELRSSPAEPALAGAAGPG